MFIFFKVNVERGCPGCIYPGMFSQLVAAYPCQGKLISNSNSNRKSKLVQKVFFCVYERFNEKLKKQGG